MPTPSEQFRADVKAVRDAIVAKVAAASPSSRIHSRLIFDLPRDKWPALLKNSSGKIDSIAVRYNGLDNLDAGLSRVTRSKAYKLPFQLIFWHEWGLGTNTSNDEDKLFDEICAVTWAIDSDPLLAPKVSGHEGLRTGQILPDPQLQMMYAQARLIVHFDYRLVVGQ
jgi:hypothetical protein